MTYGELPGASNREGLALHNMASLPHISIVGAALGAVTPPRSIDVETALAAYRARPHWGKLFLADAATLAPRGAFRNAWLEARVLGAG